MAEISDELAAAKAICEAWGYRWEGSELDDDVAPDVSAAYDERPDKLLFIKAARAAIEALAREKT